MRIKLPENCMGCKKPLAYTSFLHVEPPVWEYDRDSMTHKTTCIHCNEVNYMTEAKSNRHHFAVNWRPGTAKSVLASYEAGRRSGKTDPALLEYGKLLDSSHWPAERKQEVDAWVNGSWENQFELPQRSHSIGSNVVTPVPGTTKLHYEGDGSGWIPFMLPPTLHSLRKIYDNIAETEKRMGRMLGINEFGSEFRRLKKHEQYRRAYGGLPFIGKLEA